jgi:GWxTD domain-containing protein
VVSAACGSWQRVGQPEPVAVPAERLPQILDPAAAYRAMGLLPDPGPLGFIGVARILAGPRPDSMLVVIALSLHNRGFTFRREGDQFVADYHAEAQMRAPGGVVAAAARDERIRVGSFAETQRADESVIFQQFLTVGPGDYTLAISVRDRNGPNTGRVETAVTVPGRERSALSLPIAVYSATPRRALDRPPEFVVNPRQGVEYGADTLRMYVETYDMPAGARIAMSAVEMQTGRVVWRDTLRVDSAAAVRGRLVAVPPSALTIGRYDLRLEENGNQMASTPFLVSFSDLYAAANLEDIVALLRYFAPADTLRALLHAAPEDRAAAWQRFWHNSDPVPGTPENEAIDEYLRRLRLANDRIRNEGPAGWMTERGEVMITLGEPSEVLEQRADATGRGRVIQWTYYDYRLVLTFIDDTGFGRFRLDGRSRNEFQRVANRVRGW